MNPIYASKCDEQFNARIMRLISATVCQYHETLPENWRAIVKLQNSDDEQPFYHLSYGGFDQGEGDAGVAMKMLERFPHLSATGTDSPADMIDLIKSIAGKYDGLPESTAASYLKKLQEAEVLTDLPTVDWWELSLHDLTYHYGGIRIPYNSRVTKDQSVRWTSGEIRIAFGGAKEWQNVYFALRIFQGIQVIMNELWSSDQIWYQLDDLRADQTIGFWIRNLGLTEAPLIW